jgi:hypothetical protein
VSWAAVAIGGVAAVGAGASAYGASQQQGPTNIHPTDDARNRIQAYNAYGFPNYQLNRAFGPMYNAQNSQMAWDTLFGNQGGKRTTIVPIWEDGKVVYRHHTYQVPGTPGMMNMYKKAGRDMSDWNNERLLGDLEKYAPRLTEAYKASNPELAKINSTLTTQAQEGLDAGSGLDPFTRRQLTQASLGDASLRGFGHSPLDAYMAYSSMGQAGEQRRAMHQQQAMGIGNYVSGQTPDPISLVRQPSLATQMGPMLGSQAFGAARTNATPASYNAFGGSGYQSMPGDNGAANSWMALGGGMMNMAGGLGANYINRQPGAYNPYGIQGYGGQMSYPTMGNAGPAYTATY